MVATMSKAITSTVTIIDYPGNLGPLATQEDGTDLNFFSD